MTRLLQFIDDYDVTKEVSWASWIDRRKANSTAFAWTRLFFLLSRTFRSCKMASGDGSRRLAAVSSRNYGHISWARYRVPGCAFCADLCELAKLVRSVIRRVRIIDAIKAASLSLAIRAPRSSSIVCRE